MIKLTPKQWEMLEKMEAGAVMFIYDRDATLDGEGVSRDDYRALRRRNYIEVFDNAPWRERLAIGDAGRAVLAARKAALAKGGA